MEERYQKLRILGEMYFDVQDFRKAMENKSRSETVDDIVAFASVRYREIEADISQVMIREFRAVVPEPILAWVRESPGVGEHLAARLLGVIGDPYIARPAHAEGEGKERHLVWDEPYARNLDKLWAVCGYGDPARRRRKGMSQEEALALGNWKAKTVLRLIAWSCRKQPGSRYDLVYRAARDTYADRVHVQSCAQCKGSSAVGEPWRPGHQDGAALRKVVKEVLRDLWEAAREAHHGPAEAA